MTTKRFVLASGVLLLAGGVLAPSAGAGGGCHRAQSEGEGTVVRMVEMCFSPTVLRVAPGDTVTFENADAVQHVVTGVGWGSSELLGLGDSITETFERPGAYPYTCNLHAGMNGVVLVGDADTDATTVDSTPIASRGADDDGDDGPDPLATVLFGAGVGTAAFVAGRWTRRHAVR